MSSQAIAGATGTLSDQPPSTSIRPFISIAGNIPGIEELAATARLKDPFVSTISSPVSRSIATAANGTGRSSMSTSGISMANSSLVEIFLYQFHLQNSAGVEDPLSEQPHKPVKKTVGTDGKTESSSTALEAVFEEKFALEKIFQRSL